MRLSVINQYPSLRGTGERIQALISEFASEPKAQFRCLVAFASDGGLKLIEDPVLAFLMRGGSIYFIVGVDLGGTSREAVERLLTWKRAYPKQVDARVFTTADNAAIFHPKVYWLDAADRRVVIVGSVNATTGGLASNFEVSVEMELASEGDDVALEEFDYLWMSYSSPLPPLSEENLLEVDAALTARLRSGRPPTDAHPGEPHPLSGLKKPKATAKKKLPKGKPTALGPSVDLVMDILEETRQTQVQLPVAALWPFFRAKPERKQSIELCQVFRGEVVKSGKRPFIHLDNNTHRLEIDAVRGLPRPQIIHFWRRRDDAGTIFYELALRGTKQFRDLDALLRSEGTQTRAGARRWLLRDSSGKSVASPKGSVE